MAHHIDLLLGEISLTLDPDSKGGAWVESAFAFWGFISLENPVASVQKENGAQLSSTHFLLLLLLGLRLLPCLASLLRFCNLFPLPHLWQWLRFEILLGLVSMSGSIPIGSKPTTSVALATQGATLENFWEAGLSRASSWSLEGNSCGTDQEKVNLEGYTWGAMGS